MTTTETIFTKTDAEYAEIDKATVKARKLFDSLTKLAENGKKDTAEWLNLWKKYSETFKKAHGYNPHWAR